MAVDRQRKIRVLFINDTARNGGPGRSLYSILKFLDPAVIHRAVVLPRPGIIGELLTTGGVVDELIFEPNLVENPIEPWSRPLERSDLDAPRMRKAVRLTGNVLKASAALVNLRNTVKRGEYDLIYCNGTNADFAGSALAWATGVPAVWHVRYTSIPAVILPLHRRLSASAGVRSIVCVSKAAAALFSHCPDKVTVIHNALDIEDFAPGNVAPCLRSELGLTRDHVVFGSQGRILPRKGYIEMVRAARTALEQLTIAERDRIRFVVIGDTPEDIGKDHLAECRALVQTSGLERHFSFLGFRKDVRPYVADFDVSVVPSVYPDPLPRAVIESMAFAKPVIAFDVGGVAEMLQDRQSGALVRGVPPDVDGLAAEIVRYFRDPAMRKEHGVAARVRVEQNFNARDHARAIQDVILRAVATARA